MAALPLTSLYLPVLIVLFVILSFRVIRFRRLGMRPGTPEIDRAIRVHANFAEYAPLLVALAITAELQGVAPAVLHGLWATFILGRGLHALGLSRISGRSLPRFWGMVLTFTALLGGAGLLLWQGLRNIVVS